jgi:hypothetical protein
MSTATTRSPGRGSSRGSGRQPGRRRTEVLRRYRDAEGATRELIARPGAHGSVLVLDRDLLTSVEERLVAHLSEDEPRANAMIAANAFLAAEPGRRGCRPLEDRDICAAPFPEEESEETQGTLGTVAGATCAFRLQPVPSEMSIPALRWTRGPLDGSDGAAAVSLREAIAALEVYEPFRALTRRALARHEGDPALSCTVLRAELTRVLDSPIVLNRGVREAVLAKIARREASMSEIAIRCGRLKRDSRGRTTGETSWLARRVGLLPEGGHDQPTRWVHSEVLALIAREGLGIAPREVELG